MSTQRELERKKKYIKYFYMNNGMTMCPRPMCPPTFVHRRCVPGMLRPLDDTSRGRIIPRTKYPKVDLSHWQVILDQNVVTPTVKDEF